MLSLVVVILKQYYTLWEKMMNLTDLCVSWMYFCLQNLMEHFNPGLQKLVALGNTYVKAFQGERAGLVWGIKFREYMSEL